MPIRAISASPNSEPGRSSRLERRGCASSPSCPSFQRRGKPRLYGNQTRLSGLGTENRSPLFHSHHALYGRLAHASASLLERIFWSGPTCCLIPTLPPSSRSTPSHSPLF